MINKILVQCISLYNALESMGMDHVISESCFKGQFYKFKEFLENDHEMLAYWSMCAYQTKCSSFD